MRGSILQSKFEEWEQEVGKLGGQTKTGYSLRFKHRTDDLIEEAALFKQEDKLVKMVTKGKFTVEVPSASGQFTVDKQWQLKANPEARAAQEEYDRRDRMYLEKNRQQRMLKNRAMEQKFKI
mmetsp:Transcript_1291/g.809  ORF Transcript_1291/g.809 Transcript_1291/m.809 type:complete len:122 (+) Transcript_1291:383-748(+)